MVGIEVSEDVFKQLQLLATPLVDTPNDVIKRLLIGARQGSSEPPKKKEEKAMQVQAKRQIVPTELFVEHIISSIGERFRKVGQNRYMFESANNLLYFQNFNKEGDRQWYRIRKEARTYLALSEKDSFLCLTVPAEGIIYKIPFHEVERQVKAAGWTRDHLEVNIYNSRWVELGWDISGYKQQISYP